MRILQLIKEFFALQSPVGRDQKYLNNAVDLGDLEYRMKNLERN